MPGGCSRGNIEKAACGVQQSTGFVLMTEVGVTLRRLGRISDSLRRVRPWRVVRTEKPPHHCPGLSLLAGEPTFEIHGLRRQRAVVNLVRQRFGINEQPQGVLIMA